MTWWFLCRSLSMCGCVCLSVSNRSEGLHLGTTPVTCTTFILTNALARCLEPMLARDTTTRLSVPQSKRYTGLMQTDRGRRDLWSIATSEEGAVVYHTALTQMEVRAHQSSARRAAQHHTAQNGEWGGTSEQSYTYILKVLGILWSVLYYLWQYKVQNGYCHCR